MSPRMILRIATLVEAERLRILLYLPVPRQLLQADALSSRASLARVAWPMSENRVWVWVAEKGSAWREMARSSIQLSVPTYAECSQPPRATAVHEAEEGKSEGSEKRKGTVKDEWSTRLMYGRGWELLSLPSCPLCPVPLCPVSPSCSAGA